MSKYILVDPITKRTLRVNEKQMHQENMVTIDIAGYGEKTATDGNGTPVVLDYYDGKLQVHVWADINKEEPTHCIDLAGALESRRTKE